MKLKWTWIADKTFEQNGVAFRVMVGIPYSWTISSAKRLRGADRRKVEKELSILRKFHGLGILPWPGASRYGLKSRRNK